MSAWYPPLDYDFVLSARNPAAARPIIAIIIVPHAQPGVTSCVTVVVSVSVVGEAVV
ncbi:hypothetical protein D1872_350130 [compost metagenome]